MTSILSEVRPLDLLIPKALLLIKYIMVTKGVYDIQRKNRKTYWTEISRFFCLEKRIRVRK
jgi:hypothetical protein